MTELEMQQLSKAVATKHGIAPFIAMDVTCIANEAGETDGWALWLHNDSGRLIDLCDEHGISTIRDTLTVWAMDAKGKCIHKSNTLIREFVDIKQASRIARMRALLANR